MFRLVIWKNNIYIYFKRLLRAITYDHPTENPLFVKVFKLEQYKTFARTFHRRIAIFPLHSSFSQKDSLSREPVVESWRERRKRGWWKIGIGITRLVVGSSVDTIFKDGQDTVCRMRGGCAAFRSIGTNCFAREGGGEKEDRERI